MTNQPKYFWHYQIGFWVIMGFYLFLGGLTHLEFWVALVRNIYYPVAGFISSFVIIMLLKKYRNFPLLNRWLCTILSCAVAAVLCTVAINPITFMQSGMALGEMGIREFSAGYFNYTLIYLLWGLGYLHVDKSILHVENSENAKGDKRLMLERNNKLVPIKRSEITHIKAAGDYVEIFVEDLCYMNRATLAAFINELDSEDFFQTHRSNVVNLNHVTSLIPEAKGEYQILLASGHSVKASRTYASQLKKRLEQY